MIKSAITAIALTDELVSSSKFIGLVYCGGKIFQPLKTRPRGLFKQN